MSVSAPSRHKLLGRAQRRRIPGRSQYALAKAIGVPPRRINEIVKGQRSITADTAVRLAAFFGTDAQSWMNLQTHYDTELAKERIGTEFLAEIQFQGPRGSRHSGLLASEVIVRAKVAGSETRKDVSTDPDLCRIHGSSGKQQRNIEPLLTCMPPGGIVSHAPRFQDSSRRAMVAQSCADGRGVVPSRG